MHFLLHAMTPKQERMIIYLALLGAGAPPGGLLALLALFALDPNKLCLRKNYFNYYWLINVH